MIKKWEFYNSDEKLVNEICEKYNLNKVIGKIIVNRHVVNDEDVRIFITPTRDDFHNPFLFKPYPSCNLFGIYVSTDIPLSIRYFLRTVVLVIPSTS